MDIQRRHVPAPPKLRDMHKEAKMTDCDCTRACVKGGQKYGFVSEGKVLNQTCPHCKREISESV